MEQYPMTLSSHWIRLWDAEEPWCKTHRRKSLWEGDIGRRAWSSQWLNQADLWRPTRLLQGAPLGTTCATRHRVIQSARSIKRQIRTTRGAFGVWLLQFRRRQRGWSVCFMCTHQRGLNLCQECRDSARRGQTTEQLGLFHVKAPNGVLTHVQGASGYIKGNKNTEV